MFISRKELESIRAEIKALEQEISTLKKQNEAQAERNKKYDDSLKKRYIHETFGASDESETKSIMDEWLNGAKEDK